MVTKTLRPWTFGSRLSTLTAAGDNSILWLYSVEHDWLVAPSCCKGVAISRYKALQRNRIAISLAAMPSPFDGRVQRTAGEALGLEADGFDNNQALIAAFGLFDENNDGGAQCLDNPLVTSTSWLQAQST
jgi:hypothetical protein